MATVETPGVGRYRPTALLARLLGITPGESATLVTVLVVAAVLTFIGLPPVLRHRAARVVRPSSPSTATDDAAATTPAPESNTGRPTAPSVGAPAGASATFAEPSVSTDAGVASDTSSTASDEGSIVAPAAGELALFAAVPDPGAPRGLAVGADGTVYVATNNGTAQGEAGPSRVLAFSPDGRPGREFTVLGQPDGHGIGLTGLTLDRSGDLLALDASTARVLRIDVGSGRQTEVARLFDVPACMLIVATSNACEPGVGDDGPLPQGAAVDGQGNLYVTDGAQGLIWRIGAGQAKPVPWASATQFGGARGPAGIVVEASGSLLVTVAEALDPAAGGGGAVYRVPVGADGAPGAPATVATFARGELPGGVALLDDGSMAVALAGADAVALVGGDGSEQRRVTGRAGAVALDGPAHLALAGGTLLAANEAPTAKANWAVLAVGIR